MLEHSLSGSQNGGENWREESVALRTQHHHQGCRIQKEDPPTMLNRSFLTSSFRESPSGQPEGCELVTSLSHTALTALRAQPFTPAGVPISAALTREAGDVLASAQKTCHSYRLSLRS